MTVPLSSLPLHVVHTGKDCQQTVLQDMCHSHKDQSASQSAANEDLKQSNVLSQSGFAFAENGFVSRQKYSTSLHLLALAQCGQMSNLV